MTKTSYFFDTEGQRAVAGLKKQYENAKLVRGEHSFEWDLLAFAVGHYVISTGAAPEEMNKHVTKLAHDYGKGK